MHENSYLEECILRIESKLNWGPSFQWTASHFIRLSEDIFVTTGKKVSDSTLKRLFGKKETQENYNPQLYTKNALAEYLSFNDWQNFTNHLKNSPKQTSSKLKLSDKFSHLAFPAMVSVIGVFIILFFLTRKTSDNNAWLKTADTSRTVPFTAVFHYDISQIKDSVFIDFGNNVKTLLPREKHTITEFYKSCGVYYPKILTNKKVLDSVCLRNYSKDWQGGYSPNDDYRKFIPFEDSSVFRQQGRLYISAENLKFDDPDFKNGIYAEYRLMKDFNISLDSLNIKATVKNSPAEGGKLCYDVEIWLIGSNENCKVRFVEPGCYRYGQLKISEKEYNGRFDDLSVLARDLKDWKNIGIRIKNKKVEILYNSTSVIKENYNKRLGNFLGIYVRCYGTGSLGNVSVTDKANNKVYNSNF